MVATHKSRNASVIQHADDARKNAAGKTLSGHRVLAAIALVVVLMVLVVAWFARLNVTMTTIGSELRAATKLLPQLEDHIRRSDRDGAVHTVDQLILHTSNARNAATDPLWTIAGMLPWLGANVQAVSEVATSADDVAQLAAAPMVSVLEALDWTTLNIGGQGLDLSALTGAQPKLAAAAHAVRQSSERLNNIDVEPLLPQVSQPLIESRLQLAALGESLNVAADAASIAPAMLGANGPRRYLLLVENNAELRATGGIPGALAILSVDQGKLSLGSQTSASKLGSFSPPVTVESEQKNIYSSRLGMYMQDVNLTPDFPSAAAAAKAMWKEKTGEHLAGVLSIDPIVLAYILDATGPVKLTESVLGNLPSNNLPKELTSKNVVPTLLSDVYAEIANPQLQDVYFAGVATEIFQAVSFGSPDNKGFMGGVKKGVEERRLLLWSSSVEEQKVIANYSLSGAVAGRSVSPAQFGVYFNDGTGAKMDYYVKRTVQLIEECNGTEYRQVKIRVTSTNTAPPDAATSLPAYVTGGGVFGIPAGTVQTNVIAYGPAQANMETASVDGKKSGFAAHRHGDRPVGSLTVILPPGQSSTVELTFGKIVQHAEPDLVVTPTVQPVKDVILPTRATDCLSQNETSH